ncbi:hypothetical protein PV332_15985 [Streptomyces scabiei]|uniref:hypothetical protein n=1 Tax=Streptomyces TaxID=1883 RepID=UPI0002E4FFFD|nr:hypothetical protein [Streptomyces scabiei]MDX2576964.1 hypothetical protein [Streptomyces scabiei]MDX2656779.1 hypothetical protein [Streptomyces scabiei]MDX2724213.1 hypothetical protein [Streptomyces scabiei]MDX2868252.1 hypothetical protein [Streptomyces scabiei]MDX2887177.1 hypothetical protein [Streptomyces scabiei]
MPHQAAVSQVSWEKVADSIEFIPDQYSDRTQPESVAREMLGCDAADIDTLVEGGLPFEDRAGVRCFDANDLYNLGMYSGRSTTQPELAFRMLFRFAGRPVDDLLRPKSWTFRVRMECVDCAGVAPWHLEAPDVQRFGGRVEEVTTPTASAGSAEYTATVTTTGARTPLVSPVLRQLVHDYLDASYRWQMIPVPMQADQRLVHSLGATSCIAASLFLAERFRAAGYRAEAKRGWFCGVLGGALDLPHACVEVEDEDGALRTVDIAKAQLAARLSADTRAFQELCLGSIYNKVIPSTASCNEALGLHACGSQLPIRVRADIRAIR